MVQSFINGDDELHQRMGLLKDTYWCNIEEITPNGHNIDEDLYDDQNMVSTSLPTQTDLLISETAYFLTVNLLYMHFAMQILLKISGIPNAK